MTLPNFAITGEMRSGKDAVAEYMARKFGYTRFAFGDELKRDFHRRYPEVPREPKPRAGYQFHGQFMREQIDEDIWVNRCLAEIARTSHNYAGFTFRAVISDLRQPNEFQACKLQGFVIIRVTAPEALRIDRAIKSGDTFNLRDLTHDTESHARRFDVDYEIVNDGTLAELYAKVDEVVRNVSA
ncbi:adenylate kinase (plasmid) [Paenibacillus sp. JNUCC32]|uniref:adenylate kinase n=1 Tax=Paenibacillus sp. JNUCC32 TaxID=2777984 RepID=UPI0017883E7A|nr:adenylate kinase [Paenibacillus sp. JNUCC-32]QOT13711.1 adenylate kinase [Paenibacillus sp. JNUCC-32]